MCLGLCLHKEYREERGGAKAIDLYVLSRSIYLKPACNLVKTAQRKSQLNFPAIATGCCIDRQLKGWL
jgi:hypothetical protein